MPCQQDCACHHMNKLAMQYLQACLGARVYLVAHVHGQRVRQVRQQRVQHLGRRRHDALQGARSQLVKHGAA